MGRARTKRRQLQSKQRGEVAQTPAAQYEAAHGITPWWRGQCTCHGCRGKVDRDGNTIERSRPPCACDPYRDTLVDRNGHARQKMFRGRRQPLTSMHLWVTRYYDRERQEVVRLVRGYIADDCMAERHDPNPDIAAMTEPDAERSEIHGGARRLRRGESYEGMRTSEPRVLRGICPGCGGLSDGNLCLTCAAASKRIASARAYRAEVAQ